MDPDRSKWKRWAGKCCCFGDEGDAADANSHPRREKPATGPGAIDASTGLNGVGGGGTAPPAETGLPANVPSTNVTSAAVGSEGAASRNAPAALVDATGTSSGDGTSLPPTTTGTIEAPFTSSSETELWERAFKQVVNSAADKNLIAKIKESWATGNSGSTITAKEMGERLQALAEKNRSQDNDPDGRTGYSVRRLLDRTVSVLNTFTPVGNILFNINPLFAAGPWGAVQFVLILLGNKKQLRNDLLLGFAQVTNLTLYCHQYQALYNSSNLTSQESQGMPKKLEEAIVNTYAKALLFLGFASQDFTGNGIIFAASLKLDDMKLYIQALVDVENELVRTANTCGHYRDLQNHEKIEENLGVARKTFEAIYNQGIDIHNIRNDGLLDKLMRVRGAAHNSSEDQNDPRCHKGTRADVLKHIEDWTHDPDGKRVYWLHGKAGTGKSTIARTVAERLHDKSMLGASFLFKRGGGDRGHARYFFTTISSELCNKIPYFGQHVRQAVEKDGHISDKAIKTQFEELINSPLERLRKDPSMPQRMVVVIDALDECNNDPDARHIIDLFSGISARHAIDFRIFITSRPEYHIRLGFENNPNHTAMALDQRDEAEVKGDISSYMEYELRVIRDNYNKGVKLSQLYDWPAGTDIERLVVMAVPLFIFAATVLRFLSEAAFNPAERLDQVLKYKVGNPQEQIIATYGPVLGSLMKIPKSDQKAMTKRFQDIVGSIVLLAEPLSVSSLQQLLKPLPESAVPDMLARLHSVLDVPDDFHSPVKTFHLSFREFLIDEARLVPPDLGQFCINDKGTNESLGMKCLELLSRDNNLKPDMCDLKMPGKSRKEIAHETLARCVPAVVRYACLYWIHHLKEAHVEIDDDHLAYTFLRDHFLHWLEVLSLAGKISESIRLVEKLRSIVKPGDRGTGILEFLYDAKRFILRFRIPIDEAPLQLYSSALLFAPRDSIIRQCFEEHTDWVSPKPNVESDWNPCLQTLEGHTRHINSVAFSGNGGLMASSSADKTIKIWDVVTGELQNTLHGHSDEVNSVAFSQNGSLIASGSDDKTIKVWNAARGELQHTLDGHRDIVNSVAFTPDGKLIASGSSDETTNIWDAESGKLLYTLEGHDDWVNSVAFNAYGTLLASGSYDKTVKIWNARTWKLQSTTEGHDGWVSSVAFNADGTLIASGSWDDTVKIWDTETGDRKNSFDCHGRVLSVAFLDDAKVIAAGTWGALQIWDATTGKDQILIVDSYEVDSYGVNSISFVAKSQLVASASDKKVQIWDITREKKQQNLESHYDLISSIAFSPDSKLVASGSYDETVKIWDAINGTIKNTLKGHTDLVTSVAFSPNSKLVASGSRNGILKIWDAINGANIKTLGGHPNSVTSVAISPNSKRVAYGSHDGILRIWDVNTGNLLQSSDIPSRRNSLSFSENGSILLVEPGSLQISIEPDENTENKAQAASTTSLCGINHPPNGSTIQSQSRKRNPQSHCYSIDLGNTWVQRDGENLLWLPPDCRPEGSAVWKLSVSRQTIALGSESGRFMILAFKD